MYKLGWYRARNFFEWPEGAKAFLERKFAP